MVSYNDELILKEVLDERHRQDDKFGANRDLPMILWGAVLAEEYGEAAHEIMDSYGTIGEDEEYYLNRLRAELIQVAAVSVAIIDNIDRRMNRG